MGAGDVSSISSFSGQLSNGKSLSNWSNTRTTASIAKAIDVTVIVPITTGIVLFAINSTVTGDTIPNMNGFKFRNEGTTLVWLGFNGTSKTSYLPVAAGGTFEMSSAFLDVNTDGSALGTPTAITSVTAVAITSPATCSYVVY